MNFSKTLLALLVLVVVSAGCLGGSGTSSKVEFAQTQGVIFKSINVSSPNFESTSTENNSAEIDILVQNLGGKRANDVYIQVFGNSWGNNAPVSGCFNSTSQPFWCKVGTGSLDPPNTATSTPSIPEQASLSLRTPSLIQDQQTFAWTGRLYYRYSGTATGSSEALSETEFRKLQQQQSTTFNYDITKANSGGPIQMKISAQNPIVARQSGIPLRIEFQNVGGGRVFVPAGGASGYSQIGYNGLKLEHYDKIFIVDVTSDLGPNSVEGCPKNQEVRIGVPLSCRLKVTQDMLNVPKSNVNVKVEVVYGYQVDKTFQVPVRKLFGEDFGSGSTGTPGNTNTGTPQTNNPEQPPAI